MSESSHTCIKIATKPQTDVEMVPLVFGRNGTWEITALAFSIYGDQVYIDGYGKRDTVLNGGFRATLEDVRNLCEAFTNYEKQKETVTND